MKYFGVSVTALVLSLSAFALTPQDVATQVVSLSRFQGATTARAKRDTTCANFAGHWQGNCPGTGSLPPVLNVDFTLAQTDCTMVGGLVAGAINHEGTNPGSYESDQTNATSWNSDKSQFNSLISFNGVAFGYGPQAGQIQRWAGTGMETIFLDQDGHLIMTDVLQGNFLSPDGTVANALDSTRVCTLTKAN